MVPAILAHYKYIETSKIMLSDFFVQHYTSEIFLCVTCSIRHSFLTEVISVHKYTTAYVVFCIDRHSNVFFTITNKAMVNIHIYSFHFTLCGFSAAWLGKG